MAPSAAMVDAPFWDLSPCWGGTSEPLWADTGLWIPLLRGLHGALGLFSPSNPQTAQPLRVSHGLRSSRLWQSPADPRHPHASTAGISRGQSVCWAPAVPSPEPCSPLPCSGASMASVFPWDSGPSPSTAAGAPGAPGPPAPAAVGQECRALRGTAASPREPALSLPCPGPRMAVGVTQCWGALGWEGLGPCPALQCCRVTQTKGRGSTLRDVKHVQCPSLTEQQPRHSWSLIQSCFEKSCCSLSPCCIPSASAGWKCLGTAGGAAISILGVLLTHLLPTCPLGHQTPVALDSAKTPWCQSSLGWRGKGLLVMFQGSCFSMAWGALAAPGVSSCSFQPCSAHPLPRVSLVHAAALEGSAVSSQSWIRTWICV